MVIDLQAVCIWTLITVLKHTAGFQPGPPLYPLHRTRALLLGIFSWPECESELGLTLTYPALAFLLRRGSKTCAARPCDDYLALGSEEGTGRSQRQAQRRPFRPGRTASAARKSARATGSRRCSALPPTSAAKRAPAPHCAAHSSREQRWGAGPAQNHRKAPHNCAKDKPWARSPGGWSAGRWCSSNWAVAALQREGRDLRILGSSARSSSLLCRESCFCLSLCPSLCSCSLLLLLCLSQINK
nr:uncharacterized protein LOC129046009 [Mirounga angustirostris]